MKSANNYIAASLLVGGSLLVSTFGANAGVVTMKLDNTGYSEKGFYINGYVGTGDDVGVYQFSFLDSMNNPYQTFYSVCLSPLGYLDKQPHTYTFLSFAAANPGQYPNTWAWNNSVSSPEYWGIENACQIFVQNIGSITTSEQGAALELAIWTALYDSTGFGAINAAGSFSSAIAAGNLNGGAILAGSLGADYAAYINSISTFTGPGYPGDALQGVSWTLPGQQQLILFPSVPEPSTIFAGALLLLPLGASAVRVVRRNKTA